MRLWSIHPSYLDAKGIVALWRKALLAQAVLGGQTLGYRHHPQLVRFQHADDPLQAVGTYLWHVWQEGQARGYRFRREKIRSLGDTAPIPVRRGQLAHEFSHLKRKLFVRDRRTWASLRKIRTPRPHPIFERTPGGIETWEKLP